MERNAYFDNAKLLLIYLVVFGHAIQPFTDDFKTMSTLYTWIYTFHMPAFIFLAGFFAKGARNLKYIFRLAKKLLVPYLIFQLLYTGYYFFIGKENWYTEHIFYPHWSLWFLISLFCWHMMLILYKKMPFYVGLTVAVVIGVLVGYFDHVGQMFSLSRTFVFFPYFLLGYWTKVEHIHLLKQSLVRYGAALIMIAMLVAIYYMPDINSGWLLASKSYDTLGMADVGGIARLMVYSTSTLMVVAVLAFIPERRFSFTYLGERTLYVYLLHGFIIQLFREYNLLSVNNLFDFIGIAVIAAAIVIILSSNIVVSLWQPLIEISTSRLRNLWKEREQGSS